MVSCIVLLFLLPLFDCSVPAVGYNSDDTAEISYLPEDNFVGDNTSYVYCVNKRGRLTPWDWLNDASGEPAMVAGKWEKAHCTYGSVVSFRVSKAAYLRLLKACQDLGYKTVQPASRKDDTNWYTFKVGDFITPYYWKDGIIDKGQYFPTARVPPCNVNSTITLPNDTFAGKSSRPYVVCMKEGEALDRVALGKSSNEYMTIDGEWINRLCSFGFIEALRVSKKNYDDALSRCKDEGYETAQPSRGSKDPYASHPFQVGNYYTESYIDGKKYDAMLVPECDYGLGGGDTNQ